MEVLPFAVHGSEGSPCSSVIIIQENYLEIHFDISLSWFLFFSKWRLPQLHIEDMHTTLVYLIYSLIIQTRAIKRRLLSTTN
jgi:hypothetical protein